MSTKVKQLIALGITIIALALLYTSAYLPYVKGSLYISAMQSSQQATTLQAYLRPFDDAMNFWSPVGQPEIIRFFGNNTLSLISDQKQNLPESVATPLVSYTVQKLSSDPLGGKGLNYSQDILIEASIISAYAEKYNKPDMLSAAEQLYKKGIQLSPNRPQFLYGLFSLYLAEGKSADAKAIGQEILKYWPDDRNVATAIAGLK